MMLTAEEEAWLDGRAGEATRLALALVVRMGELFDAERLLPVTQAHVDACLYTTSNILLELIRTGQAPAAIVSRSVEPVLAVGPLVGQTLYGRTIPVVTLDAEAFARIQPGDWLVVDAERGEVSRREA